MICQQFTTNINSAKTSMGKTQLRIWHTLNYKQLNIAHQRWLNNQQLSAYEPTRRSSKMKAVSLTAIFTVVTQCSSPLKMAARETKMKIAITKKKTNHNNSSVIFAIVLLTFWSPTSTCIFSTHLFIHSLWYCLREFVLTSQHFIFGNHFIHSHDLSVWSDSVIVGRN